MFEYDYGYRYIKASINSKIVIIELSKDNMFGKYNYSAKTNLLFLDDDGTWGAACGVGKNEETALDMCVNELNHYLNSDKNTSLNLKFEEIDLPKRITFVYKEKTCVIFYRHELNRIVLLTHDGKVYIEEQDILKYIKLNVNKLINQGVDEKCKDFFVKNNFYPTFGDLLKRDNENDKNL